MNEKEIADSIRNAADTALATVLAQLPTRSEDRFFLFLTIQRVFDVACVDYAMRHAPTVADSYRLDILHWGMNAATAYLFEPLRVRHALPMGRTTELMREIARGVIHNFGVISLARRAADMVEYGFLLAERSDDAIVLRDSTAGAIQSLDRLEDDHLSRARAEWTKESQSVQGWTVCGADEIESRLQSPGAYMARDPERLAPVLSGAELRQQMIPLIKPWRTQYGTMMGYGAAPDIDAFFLGEAMSGVDEFRESTGIHPDTDFGFFSGRDLAMVTLALTSFFRKHVVFALLAVKHFPEIDIRESFTIWGPRSELIDAVVSATPVQKRRVKHVLDRLTITAADSEALAAESTPIRPMLVDLGNDFYLKPVSWIFRNPLVAFLKIGQWRDASTRNRVAESREAWFRRDVYGVFGGNRYFCVPGNVVLREGKQRLTDIDAAIFDRTNGELALIQLKWQDFFTNDIRELRSKARNLSSQLDDWGDRVNRWIARTPPAEVAKALRIKLHGNQRITAIFLFGISRAVARPHGYGFPVTNEYISVASWPQFARVRGEIGPARAVLSKMHERLREEEQRKPAQAKPFPVEIELPNLRLKFVDLWNDPDDDSEPAAQVP